jgi:hypothetical protein
MAEPAGAAIPAIRPGDDSERLGAFFDRMESQVAQIRPSQKRIGRT